MTRAKDELHLIVPQRFYTHQQPSLSDRHVHASRTRFIPDSILDRFEILTWTVATAQDDRASRGTSAPVDLKARMRGMWG